MGDIRQYGTPRACCTPRSSTRRSRKRPRASQRDAKAAGTRSCLAAPRLGVARHTERRGRDRRVAGDARDRWQSLRLARGRQIYPDRRQDYGGARFIRTPQPARATPARSSSLSPIRRWLAVPPCAALRIYRFLKRGKLALAISSTRCRGLGTSGTSLRTPHRRCVQERRHLSHAQPRRPSICR